MMTNVLARRKRNPKELTQQEHNGTHDNLTKMLVKNAGMENADKKCFSPLHSSNNQSSKDQTGLPVFPSSHAFMLVELERQLLSSSLLSLKSLFPSLSLILESPEFLSPSLSIPSNQFGAHLFLWR